MKKIEYKLLTISAAHLQNKNFRAELDSKFARWGYEGWDLVKMEPIVTGGLFFQGANTREFIVIFKRERPEE